jgi:hypothetical protein
VSRLLVIAATILVVASGAVADSARADGDPASDVLATQALFLPQDVAARPAQEAQLGSLLRTAQRDAYQIRVALVASSADLGSVTELWRQPQNYAQFLGQELSLLYRGTLLVVMPNGYGLYRPAGPPAADRAVIAGLHAPGPDLAGDALTAVQRLAAAAGHYLPLPSATTSSRASTGSTVPWLVFGVGAALIIAAWTASLWARPLRARDTA